MVSPQRDRVAVFVVQPGWSQLEALGAAGELVAARLEPHPAFMGRVVADCECGVTDVDAVVEVRETAGGGELTGVGICDIGVSAADIPGEMDDLLATCGLADAVPVLDAQPDGGVRNSRVDTATHPRCVRAGACVAASHLEEPLRVLAGVAESDEGDGVRPDVKWARVIATTLRTLRSSTGEPTAGSKRKGQRSTFFLLFKSAVSISLRLKRSPQIPSYSLEPTIRSSLRLAGCR